MTYFVYDIRLYDIRVYLSTNRSKRIPTSIIEIRVMCTSSPQCTQYYVINVYVYTSVYFVGSCCLIAVTIGQVIRDNKFAKMLLCRLRWFLICFRLDSQAVLGCTHAHTCADTPLLYYYPALGL